MIYVAARLEGSNSTADKGELNARRQGCDASLVTILEPSA